MVGGGNHSIAAGILGQEGYLVPADVMDLSPLFDRVDCDGIHFLDKQTRQPIARVANERMGAFFEIGRLMSTHSRRPGTLD